ncbi:MAG: heme exporter protein CcmD [Pseudomonadota bacterium]
MSAVYWSSWQAFIEMGGYGLYVWGSLGMVLVAIALEQLLLAQRRQAAIRAISTRLDTPDNDDHGGQKEGLA